MSKTILLFWHLRKIAKHILYVRQRQDIWIECNVKQNKSSLSSNEHLFIGNEATQLLIKQAEEISANLIGWFPRRRAERGGGKRATQAHAGKRVRMVLSRREP